MAGSPIAALIVRVLADTSEIKENLKSVESSMTNMGTIATKVGSMIAGAFTVSAIVNFGRSLIDSADALVKLSDKTGLSFQGLQKLQIAGDDAGNTIDQMATAINQMQKRLVGDDKSALAALDALHINLVALRMMQPDQQFMAIADAIRLIHDPAEQVAIAIAIFGRNGAEILPTIKRGFDDVKNAAVGMSDETVKNLDAVGDAIDGMWRAFKGTAANSVVGLWKALGKAQGDVLDLEVPLAGDIELTTQAVTKMADPVTKVTDHVKKLAVAKKELLKTLPGVTYELRSIVREIHNYTTAVPGAIGMTGRLNEDMSLLEGHANTASDAIVGTMDDMQGMVRDGVEPLAGALEGRFADALSRIPQLFVDAFTGKGGVIGALKAIGVSLLDAITRDILQPVWDAVASWVGGIVRAIAGAFSGGGGISSSIGAISSAVGGGGGNAAAGIAAGIGMAALSYVPVAGALLFAATHMNGPDVNHVMGGNDRTIAENIAIHNRMSPAEQQAEFVRLNPQLAATMAAEAAGNSFAGGSGGMRNFGRGQLAMLHGQEEVVTKGQRDRENAIADKIDAMHKDLIYTLPIRIAKATTKRGGG